MSETEHEHDQDTAVAEQHDHGHDHDHDHGHSHGHDHSHAMDVVVEELGPCKKLLKVSVPASEIETDYAKRIAHLRKRVHLKGFRKGKAPKARIEKLYGESVLEEVREHLVRHVYVEAIKEKVGTDKVLGEGKFEKLEFDRKQGLEFEIVVHTRPEFELESYTDVKVEVEPLTVDDSDVQAQIDMFRRTRGDMRPVEGEDVVVEGEDHLTVDLQVWLADEFETWSKAQEEGAQSDLKPLKEEFGLEVQLPSDYLGDYEVDDLEDALTGLKVGEWGDTETDLPEDFDVIEGRGEGAVLRVRVEAIRRLFLPELTDELAKEAGFETVADLRRETRERLQEAMEVARRGQIEDRILLKLIEQTGEFELPVDIVDAEIENAEKRRTQELRREGSTEQEAENEVAEERDEIRTKVVTMLRKFFVADEVARREKLQVTGRDVEARIARIAASQGMNPQHLHEQLQKMEMLPQIRQDILDQKIRTFLRERAEIVEVAAD
ncbi:MAG: trigger factor [Planctomycetes bacterium]|nr:trigger factor [Planctomycetota bacterium]